MSKQKQANLNELKTFYDPHPGLAGALSPIPARIKEVANELDGKTMTLGKALARLERVNPGGKIKPVPKYNFISLDIVINGLRNVYRVIRYK